MIMNTISEDLLDRIVYASDAHLVWEDLKERFDKVNQVRIWQLQKESTTLMQGINSISAYFSKLKELWHEYDVLVSSSSYDYEKSKDYMEHLSQKRLLHIFSGLNESYDQARRQTFMKLVASTLRQAYAMIIQDKSQPIAATNMTSKITEQIKSLTMQTSGMSLPAEEVAKEGNNLNNATTIK